MTEKEYINLSNLKRIESAILILAEVTRYKLNPEVEQLFGNSLADLHKVADKMRENVKIKNNIK